MLSKQGDTIMAQQQFTRKDYLITNVDTGEQNHHKSINKAKQASRKLQTEGNTMTVLKSRNTRLHVKVYSK